MGFFDSDEFEKTTSKKVVPLPFSYENGNHLVKVVRTLPHFSLSRYYFGVDSVRDDSGVSSSDDKSIQEPIVKLVNKKKNVLCLKLCGFTSYFFSNLIKERPDGYGEYSLVLNDLSRIDDSLILFNSSLHSIKPSCDFEHDKEISRLKSNITKNGHSRSIPSVIEVEVLSVDNIVAWAKKSSQSDLKLVFDAIEPLLYDSMKKYSQLTLNSDNSKCTVEQTGTVITYQVNDGNVVELQDEEELEISMF